MKNCRICGKELILKPDPDCPEAWVKTLSNVPMCCTLCGEYGWRRLRLREDMQRMCIHIIGQQKPPSDKQILAMHGFTRRYSKLVCDFYRVQVTWEKEFPEMILTSPQSCLLALDEFEKGVASIAGVPVVNASPVGRGSVKPALNEQIASMA